MTSIGYIMFIINDASILIYHYAKRSLNYFSDRQVPRVLSGGLVTMMFKS